ncbi:MAG: phosphatidylserine decarboxylase [Gammaproteobacteria bacterium]|nr:phosphatidylserine decarboxylase [Gammaproteobacteria bacterium]
MTIKYFLNKFFHQESINFWLTNRIPRQWLTRWMGWFSQIEQPWVRDLSITLWRYLADPDLSDAKKTRFSSLHDCFIRELQADARPIASDPEVIVSPCDAIVGACGKIEGTELVQAKGFPYTLCDLLADPDLVGIYRNGHYITLRITATMYHRFHAPHDCRVEQVTYITGDTWNVNPIALKRIEKLFCKNERAVIRCRLEPSGHLITLVPVAAVLVASIRLHCLDVLLHLRHRGPTVMACNAHLRKGEEMGWFQHGSTIIVFAPPGFNLCAQIQQGAMIRMGQRLLHLPTQDGITSPL